MAAPCDLIEEPKISEFCSKVFHEVIACVAGSSDSLNKHVSGTKTDNSTQSDSQTDESLTKSISGSQANLSKATHTLPVSDSSETKLPDILQNENRFAQSCDNFTPLPCDSFSEKESLKSQTDIDDVGQLKYLETKPKRQKTQNSFAQSCDDNIPLSSEPSLSEKENQKSETALKNTSQNGPLPECTIGNPGNQEIIHIIQIEPLEANSGSSQLSSTRCQVGVESRTGITTDAEDIAKEILSCLSNFQPSNIERVSQQNVLDGDCHVGDGSAAAGKLLVDCATQANDYEIERRSGRVPARKRIVPYKFRDFRNPDVVDKADEEDSDYDPDQPEELAKRKRVSVARKPGRPKKSKVPDKATESSDNIQEVDVGEQDDTAKLLKNHPRGRGRPRSRPDNSDHYQCETCQKFFTQKGNLKVHQLIHTGEKPFICSMEGCDKSFRSNETLRRHKMSHLGIKVYECTYCQNKFSSNVSLQEHMARHNNTKPYTCQSCQKQFRQVSCLRRHVITHSSEMPFKCDLCGRRFSQLVYLRSHMKVHTGERPFSCEICQKSFAHQSDLSRHKIIHTGQKPYICDVCGTRFSDPSSKRRHEREHLGNKPYLCQLCGESFKRAGQLKAHLGRKHTDDSGQEIAIIHRNDKGSLEFAFRDGSRYEQIGDEVSVDNEANIIKLLEDPLVQHVQITLPLGSHPSQISLPQIIEMETGSNIVSDGNEKEHTVIADENGAQIPVHIGSGIAIQGDELNEETVIAIAEVSDMGQQLETESESVEYTYEIIEGLSENADEGADMVEVQYEDGNVDPTDQDHDAPDNETLETNIESHNAADEGSPPDFVANPDFNSQAYYNWLTNFTELCKVLPMPLQVSLFQKISQVHKTLSDLMANPSGVVADKDNFKVLMQISKELNTIINEHLAYVLDNLGQEKNEEA